MANEKIISSKQLQKALSEFKDQYDPLKQDKLPTVVNDKYLHTNASTGALEWVDSGSTDFQVLNSLPIPTNTSPKVVFNLNDRRLYILDSSEG